LKRIDIPHHFDFRIMLADGPRHAYSDLAGAAVRDAQSAGDQSSG
jgi:hypothetical protein